MNKLKSLKRKLFDNYYYYVSLEKKFENNREIGEK